VREDNTFPAKSPLTAARAALPDDAGEVPPDARSARGRARDGTGDGRGDRRCGIGIWRRSGPSRATASGLLDIDGDIVLDRRAENHDQTHSIPLASLERP
jgi:hypothetical protein